MRPNSISLAEYVENALRGPNGYYRGKVKFGPDFETFAQEWAPLLADRFFLAWKSMIKFKEIQKTEIFYIYEFGAGNGKMAHVILKYLQGRASLEPKSDWPDFYQQVHYVIGEISSELVELQKQELQTYLLKEKISIFKTDARIIDDVIPRGKGIVVSNELIDTFPPHEITLTENVEQATATVVEISENKDTPVQLPVDQVLNTEELRFFNETMKNSKRLIFQYPLTFCLHPSIDNYYQKLKDILIAGFVFTLDYGTDGLENILKDAEFPHIRTFSEKHGSGIFCFKNAGEVDITSDVNFSDLERSGRALGFDFTYYGMRDSLGGLALDDFRVLIQRRNININCDKEMCDGMKESSPIRYEEMLALLKLLIEGENLLNKAISHHETMMTMFENNFCDYNLASVIEKNFSQLENALNFFLDWLYENHYSSRDRAFINILNERFCRLILNLVELAYEEGDTVISRFYSPKLYSMLSKISGDERYAKILLSAIANHMEAMISHPNPKKSKEISDYKKNRSDLIFLISQKHPELASQFLNYKNLREYNFDKTASSDEKQNSLLSRCLAAADSENKIIVQKSQASKGGFFTNKNLEISDTSYTTSTIEIKKP